MKKMSVLLLLAAFPFLMLAQTSPTNLTLQQAVNIALEKNISVITTQNTFKGQQSELTSAYGSLLPTLSANGGWSRQETHQPGSSPYTYNLGGSLISIPGSPGISTTNYYQTSLQAGLVLFDGFSNTSTLSHARNTASSDEYTLYRTRQSVVYQAQQLYLTVLRNKSLLGVAQDNLESSNRQLEQIVESNKVGSVAIADVYRQQVQTAADELALINAQNTYDNSIADLQFFLGVDVSKDYSFIDSSITADTINMNIQELGKQYTDFNELLQEALQTRPDYQAALYAEQSAESDVTGARSGYYPTISANAGYTLSNSELNKLTDIKAYSWGLNFSLPLFNGFQTNTDVQLKQLALNDAQAQVDQVRRQVGVDVKKAILNYQSTLKEIDVAEREVVSATEDRSVAQEKYNVGAGTLLDLLTAVAEYTKSASDRVNGIYDFLLAKQQLKYVIGTEKY
jgi:outer membrane protein